MAGVASDPTPVRTSKPFLERVPIPHRLSSARVVNSKSHVAVRVQPSIAASPTSSEVGFRRMASEDISMPEESEIYAEIYRAKDRWLSKYPDLPISSNALLVAPIIAALTQLAARNGDLPVEPTGKQKVINIVQGAAIGFYWIGFGRCMSGEIPPITSIDHLDRDTQEILGEESREVVDELLWPIMEYVMTSSFVIGEGSEIERDIARQDLIHQIISFGVSSLIRGITEASAKQTECPLSC